MLRKYMRSLRRLDTWQLGKSLLGCPYVNVNFKEFTCRSNFSDNLFLMIALMYNIAYHTEIKNQTG